MVDKPNLERRTVLKGTAAATLAGVASGTAGANSHADDTDGAPDGDDGDVALIAHRGFAGLYPENTVGAVRNASRGGASNAAANRRADMIEIDVLPCGGVPHRGEDFEVVVFHDHKLAKRDGGERGLTDAPNQYVWETDCETVQNAEVLESGETVPTLSAVLEAIPPSVGVNIEFKNPGDPDIRFAEKLSGQELEERKDVWRPFTRRVLDVAGQYDNDILVSSFLEAALATVREVDSSVPLGTLFWDSISTGLEITETYDCEAVHPPYNMVMDTPFFNDEYYLEAGSFEEIDLVERAHEDGRAVNTWTITTWYQAEQLVDAGVDGVIANYPGVLNWDA